MPPYDAFLLDFKVTSYQEFYTKLNSIARDKMGLNGVPFPLAALENSHCPEVFSFITQCGKVINGDNSDAQAIKLIKYLKENPPKESYENPKFPDSECTQEESFLIEHILYFGIDLPGSKHNPFGHLQYFSSFFIDMYFGNYTEFMDHVKGLSKQELHKELNRREGYCRQSPIFAPINGLRIANMDNNSMLTRGEKLKIKTMYNCCNEKRNLDIMRKLIELGADVNAHDIHGYTPLHYALFNADVGMMRVLLKHGANPNAESRNGVRPLSFLKLVKCYEMCQAINELMHYGARLKSKKEIILLRNDIECYGSKELVIKVREAHPRNKEECEKCVKPSVKMCSACGHVYYCSPACQKLDWKFHKDTCKKNKRQMK